MCHQRIVEAPLAIPTRPSISADLKDLLYKIMVKDPTQRISMKGIMEHRWFQTDLPEGAMDMNKKLQKQKSGIQVRSILSHHLSFHRVVQTEEDIRAIVEEAKNPFMEDERLGYDLIDSELDQMRKYT